MLLSFVGIREYRSVLHTILLSIQSTVQLFSDVHWDLFLTICNIASVLTRGNTLLTFEQANEVTLIGKAAKINYFKHRFVGSTQKLACAIDTVLVQIGDRRFAGK